MDKVTMSFLSCWKMWSEWLKYCLYYKKTCQRENYHLKQVQRWMDTHSSRQTIPINRPWQIFASWNIQGSCRRCKNAVWARIPLRRRTRPESCKLYTMAEERWKNIPTECYLGKFGFLASLSASHRNKNFKAKRIQGDLMFSLVELEVECLKKTESIIKDS